MACRNMLVVIQMALFVPSTMADWVTTESGDIETKSYLPFGPSDQFHMECTVTMTPGSMELKNSSGCVMKSYPAPNPSPPPLPPPPPACVGDPGSGQNENMCWGETWQATTSRDANGNGAVTMVASGFTRPDNAQFRLEFEMKMDASTTTSKHYNFFNTNDGGANYGDHRCPGLWTHGSGHGLCCDSRGGMKDSPNEEALTFIKDEIYKVEMRKILKSGNTFRSDFKITKMSDGSTFYEGSRDFGTSCGGAKNDVRLYICGYNNHCMPASWRHLKFKYCEKAGECKPWGTETFSNAELKP